MQCVFIKEILQDIETLTINIEDLKNQVAQNLAPFYGAFIMPKKEVKKWQMKHKQESQ